jgi:tripartite-type tricarboxylate transporter receptor subunit TctC
MLTRRSTLTAALFGAALAACGTCSAQAQTVEQFYKGKTIDLAIGYPPGGSNDLYARLLAAHLGKHIPGNPQVVARNMPGAGSFLAVNWMTSVAPKDGTAIAIGAPTLAIDEKLGTQGVRYKTAQFHWLGRMTPLINIVMIRKSSPVHTIEDAMKTEVSLAGTGAGSTVAVYPTVMNNMFGTKFKLVMGYKGSNEAMLAVERGEVEGHSTAWEALKHAHPTWVKDGFVVLPVQFALKRIAELPNVPTALEFAKSDEQKRVLSAILAATEVGISFFTTPGVPDDRVTALRKAFSETMTDPELKADIAKIRAELDPMSGEDLQKLVADVNDLPADLTEKVKKVYQQH